MGSGSAGYESIEIELSNRTNRSKAQRSRGVDLCLAQARRHDVYTLEQMLGGKVGPLPAFNVHYRERMKCGELDPKDGRRMEQKVRVPRGIPYILTNQTPLDSPFSSHLDVYLGTYRCHQDYHFPSRQHVQLIMVILLRAVMLPTQCKFMLSYNSSPLRYPC